MNEDLARRQLRENANSLTWLLGHIASTRFDLLGLTGVKTASPWGDLFDTAINKTDQSKYPKLGEIKSVWEELTAKLMEKLPKVDKARLEQPVCGSHPQARSPRTARCRARTQSPARSRQSRVSRVPAALPRGGGRLSCPATARRPSELRARASPCVRRRIRRRAERSRPSLTTDYSGMGTEKSTNMPTVTKAILWSRIFFQKKSKKKGCTTLKTTSWKSRFWND